MNVLSDTENTYVSTPSTVSEYIQSSDDRCGVDYSLTDDDGNALTTDEANLIGSNNGYIRVNQRYYEDDTSHDFRL